MYPVNLIPKSNPEKRTRQNLTLKHYLEKRTYLTLNPKYISRKTFPPNPYPKTHLPKTYLMKP